MAHKVINDLEKASTDVHDLKEWTVPDLLSAKFARDYLLTFYSKSVDPDEKLVLSFLADAWKRIGPVECFADIGCGPTIHHSLSAAKFARRIEAFDFVPECVEEVRRWKEMVPPIHNWNPWTQTALEAEGMPSSGRGIEDREMLLRSKLTKLGGCDLRADMPLGSQQQYRAVGCFYATEQASMVEESWSHKRRIDAWRRVMGNLANLVAPGGTLLMSCVGYTDHYVTYDKDTKERVVHPLPKLTEKDFSKCLQDLGFNLKESVVRREPVIGQEKEGVTDVILVAAKR